LYPVGLASYYPTPPTVSWSNATTWHAAIVVVPVLIVLAWASWRSRVWRFGVLWFFATLSATLPFMPARNVLAADRYMYLPIIGLLWPTAVTLLWLWQQVILKTRGWIRRGLVPTAVVVVVLAMIGQCWNIEWYYETPLKKTMRVAYLFPDVPRVWERLGWSYYKQGAYDTAVKLAKKELRHDAPNVKSGAYQLIGMSLFKRGDTKSALSYLHKAIDVDPDNALGMYRLATVYDDIGKYETALPYYEKAVEAAPLHNPTLHRLAAVYRKLNRRADARRTYAREIQNNAFEIPAYVGLAEMDIKDGNEEALRHARKELTTILKLVPDSATARITLGIVLARMGRTREAIDAYRRALASNPDHPTALVNLAELYNNTGDTDRAETLFGRASALPLTIEQAQAVSDFFVARQQWTRAEAVWNSRLSQAPEPTNTRLRLGWVYAMQGDLSRAKATLPEPDASATDSPLALSLRAFIALRAGNYKDAVEHVRRLNAPSRRAKEARRRLLSALERFDHVSPGNPWTFCVAARLLLANGQREAARTSLGLCRSRCADDLCRQEAELIDAALNGPGNPN